MYKKLISLLLIILVIAIGLTGCIYLKSNDTLKYNQLYKACFYK